MHTKTTYDRRLFLKGLLGGPAVLLLGTQAACKPADALAHITGSIVGANFKTGHLARNADALPKPSKTIATDVLIVGGGISGLSAKRWLEKEGHRNVLLLEMDDHVGGNSHYGKNEVSAYPWGAHYLPVPDVRNKELLDFLRQAGVITGYSETGLPVYNEYYLCHDPEERLFINGLWQEGIVPEAGVPEQEKEQFRRFSKVVNDYKAAIGTDGKDAFAIPVDHSSADAAYRELDKISFKDYLAREGYTSPYLLWYLEYGCKDDYGANLATTSAWAGLHYFAARKGTAANGNSSTVITWPNGNGFLMDHLKKQVEGSGMLTNQLVFKIAMAGNSTEVTVYDVPRKESYTVTAGKVIMCTPQFVNQHLLGSLAAPAALYKDFRYSPWVIANITINNLPQHRGLPLCWDNVIYGTKSVGYVDANHQDLKMDTRRVLTFYLPLAFDEPDMARKSARDKDHRYWLELIAAELEYAHPGITPFIEHADVWIWGHGMIAPGPGFIWGESRRKAGESIDNKIFFAHTDLSGISIFEEAFNQGIKAARQAMT